LLNKHGSSIIVSCTTDGFISSEKNLSEIIPSPNDLFSALYYNTRLRLTGFGALLETKFFEPLGVIS